MVNTEPHQYLIPMCQHYNILNIVVNTERVLSHSVLKKDYNILNIVVNTELIYKKYIRMKHYNILNIVVNTELKTIPRS